MNEIKEEKEEKEEVHLFVLVFDYVNNLATKS